MKIVTNSDAGTARIDTTARIGLISSIMIRTPRIVRRAVISWVSVCWSDCWMLSMSFVTRLRTSPRGWLSK